MYQSNRLALFHYWVAFGLFAPAVVLGFWQMLMRSPLPAPLDDPVAYYASVTLHGTVMAYVLTTFFIMGFGYAVAATSLGRPVRGMTAAWIGFVICLLGTVIAAVTILAGRASVLYTFYPPLLASTWYYGGVFLLVGGSMIWVVLMIINMIAWKRDNPGEPVPLAMFAITATALLWAWSASGVVIELLGVILPAAFGWTTKIDAGLGRTLFSVTLHSIVYFWLMPAYIAYYTLAPQAAGGRLYSDTMGRLTFIMLLVFAVPVGMHHLFADPEVGGGFKFLQGFLTFFVALPTLLTVFSICASLEIAGRARGGRGLLGWIGALPWEEPMVLAVALSLVMLGLGGFGGFINMSYAMNSMIHNTSWVTAHFHLIFGGAVVIMYFAIAYEMWPRITGKPLRSKTLGSLAAVVVVLGHADHHDPLAHRRADGPAASRRHLRLQHTVRRPHGRPGRYLGDRRFDPAEFSNSVDHRARSLACGRENGHRAAELCACGQPAGAGPGRAEWLRAVELDPAGTDASGLRLSDWPIPVCPQTSFGCGLRRDPWTRQRAEPAMTRDKGPFSLANPWPRAGWGALAVILGISLVLGFIVLSRYQQNGEPLGVWAAICRGLGIAPDVEPASAPQPPLRTATLVAWTGGTLDQIAAGNAKDGAFVALNCTACHGEGGVSTSDLIPTLAGMDPAVIYKQLADYRSGKRLWGVMNGMAKALSVKDSADVASYFAGRPGGLPAVTGLRVPEAGRTLRQSNPAIRLVFAGDPARGIAPCSACHGPGGYKLGAPALQQQRTPYIESQLLAFAQGMRQNDISEQMRTIATQLTPEEMHAVAAYYGGGL